MTAAGTLADRRFRVVGGGIAGLAVATALARRQALVTVSEQAPAIGEVGAGLQISPNGLRVIDALGLGDALRDVSVRAGSIRLSDHRGRTVTDLDLKGLPNGQDYLFVHRARLVDVLEAGARSAGAAIETGTRVVPPLSRDDEPVIGADGLHSAIRAEINGPSEPFFTGQVAWRALVPDPAASPRVDVFMGPGRHVVSYPLGQGLRNIVAVEERDRWASEGWHHEGDPGELRTAFAGFAGPVGDWLGEVRKVHLWGLFRHPVARRWFGKGYAILGDAAHPTLPFLAQGANMALEDAWVLARCLAEAPSDEALSRYQQERRERVVRVIEAANANARNYHLSNPLLRFAAHTGLRALGAMAPGRMLRRFDWLYGHDVTRA